MVIGILLVGMAAAVALLVACSLRLSGLVPTVLVGYVLYTGNLGAVTLLLSPIHAVTRLGLFVTEAILLAGALWLWSRRGRPAVSLISARTSARAIVTDPVTAVFLGLVLVLLAYEVLLASGPPNNMDSLTYHLSRAAAWRQHGGIYWIPWSPEVELNAYQPLAEQQILYLFVATGTGAVYAVPQFLAQLVVLVSVYGAARRLGFEVRAAACASFLLATCSVVALESITAQNDLVTASFAAVAVCLLLGDSPAEAAFGGASAAFALGTKLTGGLILPVLAVLAWVRGRRLFGWAVAGGIAGLVTVAMWGYVLNVHYTGHLLGTGTEGVQDRGSPSYPRSVANGFYLLYGLMDVSVLSNRTIQWLELAGSVVAVAVAAWRWRAGVRRAVGEAVEAAVPFFAPLVVIGGALLWATIARPWGFPIRGAGGLLPPLEENLNMTYTKIANEDYSAFGPVGIVALVGAAGWAIALAVRHRADRRQVVLASALPVFLVLISAESVWVPFLIRFFLIPAVVTAPLLARLFRSRVVTASYVVVAGLAIVLTLIHDQPKQLSTDHGRPWSYSQAEAMNANSDVYVGEALTAFQQLTPAHACVGAIIGPNEPAYLLYGSNFQHKVLYLPPDEPVSAVYAHDLDYVVVGTWTNRASADKLSAAGWTIHELGDFWLLATSPHPRAAGGCRI